jgi:hypothetical protein
MDLEDGWAWRRVCTTYPRHQSCILLNIKPPYYTRDCRVCKVSMETAMYLDSTCWFRTLSCDDQHRLHSILHLWLGIQTSRLGRRDYVHTSMAPCFAPISNTSTSSPPSSIPSMHITSMTSLSHLIPHITSALLKRGRNILRPSCETTCTIHVFITIHAARILLRV